MWIDTGPRVLDWHWSCGLALVHVDWRWPCGLALTQRRANGLALALRFGTDPAPVRIGPGPVDWHWPRGLALALRIGTGPTDWRWPCGLALAQRVGAGPADHSFLRISPNFKKYYYIFLKGRIIFFEGTSLQKILGRGYFLKNKYYFPSKIYIFGKHLQNFSRAASRRALVFF